MPRLMLTDEHWSKLNPIMLENGIYDKRGPRLANRCAPEIEHNAHICELIKVFKLQLLNAKRC